MSPYYDVGGVASITAARGGGGQAGAVFINIEPLRRSTTGSSGTNPADLAPGSDGDKRAASSARGALVHDISGIFSMLKR